MKFPGYSCMAYSETYTYTRVSLDPPSTTEILSQCNLALDIYRISEDPVALQELLFPQRVRHAETPGATHGYAQSSLGSIARS